MKTPKKLTLEELKLEVPVLSPVLTRGLLGGGEYDGSIMLPEVVVCPEENPNDPNSQESFENDYENDNQIPGDTNSGRNGDRGSNGNEGNSNRQVISGLPNMQPQISNMCTYNCMAYIADFIFGGKHNHGEYLKAYNDYLLKQDPNHKFINDGPLPDEFEEFIKSQFNNVLDNIYAESAIDEGAMAIAVLDGGHAVVIIGYEDFDNDNKADIYIYIDPEQDDPNRYCEDTTDHFSNILIIPNP
jgi:hypothetical protein